MRQHLCVLLWVRSTSIRHRANEDPEVSKLNRLSFSAMRINQSAFVAKWLTTIQPKNFDWTKQLTRKPKMFWNSAKVGQNMQEKTLATRFETLHCWTTVRLTISVSPVDTNKWVFESNHVHCSLQLV